MSDCDYCSGRESCQALSRENMVLKSILMELHPIVGRLHYTPDLVVSITHMTVYCDLLKKYLQLVK